MITLSINKQTPKITTTIKTRHHRNRKILKLAKTKESKKVNVLSLNILKMLEPG
jgi:hypothetical protein